MSELQEIVNLQITDYLKPKYPIFKIHYLKVFLEKRDEDLFADEKEYYTENTDKSMIVESKPKNEEKVNLKEDSGYIQGNFELSIEMGICEDFFKKYYNPTTQNGLYTICPLVIKFSHNSEESFFIYKIERLA